MTTFNSLSPGFGLSSFQEWCPFDRTQFLWGLGYLQSKGWPCQRLCWCEKSHSGLVLPLVTKYRARFTTTSTTWSVRGTWYNCRLWSFVTNCVCLVLLCHTYLVIAYDGSGWKQDLPLADGYLGSPQPQQRSARHDHDCPNEVAVLLPMSQVRIKHWKWDQHTVS